MPAVDGGVPVAVVEMSALCERTDRGKDSRDPPQTDDGAMARMEAFVSRELRRCGRCDDDARVSTDALSDRRLLAVALRYVVGTCGVR